MVEDFISDVVYNDAVVILVLASKQVATSNLDCVETTILLTHMDILKNN